MGSYKLKFENGRCCTVEADSKPELISKIKEAEERFSCACKEVGGNFIDVKPTPAKSKPKPATKSKEVIDAEKELKKAKSSKISSYIDEASKKLDEAYSKDKKFATGGKSEIKVIGKDSKNNITYSVRPSETRKDRWEVVESSPTFKSDGIVEFVSEQDAIQYAKMGAGIIKENTPSKFATGGNIPSIEKRVAEVNALIKEGNEKGVQVVDSSSTWQAPMKYKQIKYSNGVLYISWEELDMYRQNKGKGTEWKNESFKIGKTAGGKSINKGSAQTETLTDIARMYRKALNQFDKYGYANGGGIDDEKYYVIDAKNGKIMSIAFDTEEEAKSQKYKLFEKSGNHFLTQKLIANNSAHFLNNMVADKMEKIKTMSSFADMVRNFSEPVTKKDLENMLPDYVSGSDITKVLSHTDSVESNLEVVNKGGDRYDMGVNWEVRENGKVIAKGNIVGDYPVVFKGKEYEGLIDLSESINAKLVEIEDEDDDYKHGGYVAVGEKDGYWTIVSTPTTKENATNFISSLPRGEVGKIVTVEEAKAHKKVIGKEYLEKMEKGGSTNSGLSWHQDRARHNKSENYEAPISDRKKLALGGMMVANEVSNRLPATTSAIDRRMAERIYSERPSRFEDRGLKYAIGGMIGNEIQFDHYGENKNGTITEAMSNGNFAVSSGFGSYLVEPHEVISITPNTQKNKRGWFFAQGGSPNSGLSWHQDHARHNKSENYEVPISERKKYKTGGAISGKTLKENSTHKAILNEDTIYIYFKGLDIEDISDKELEKKYPDWFKDELLYTIPFENVDDLFPIFEDLDEQNRINLAQANDEL